MVFNLKSDSSVVDFGWITPLEFKREDGSLSDLFIVKVTRWFTAKCTL